MKLFPNPEQPAPDKIAIQRLREIQNHLAGRDANIDSGAVELPTDPELPRTPLNEMDAFDLWQRQQERKEA